MNLGQTIKLLRRSFTPKMTQTRLAELCGVTQVYVSLLENNKKKPGIIKLEELSKALGVPISVLVLLSEYESLNGSWGDLLGDVVLKIKQKTKLE